MVATAIAEFLHYRGHETGVVATAGAVAPWLARHPQDLLILDVALPDRGGLEMLADLRRDLPGLPVIVLTGGDVETIRPKAEGLGVLATISKSRPYDGLAAAIATIPERAPDSHGSLLNPKLRISPRRYEVLRLLAAGERGPEIAAALGISVGTVEEHTVWLRRVLNAKTTGQLVSEAYRHGFLSIPARPDPGSL